MAMQLFDPPRPPAACAPAPAADLRALSILAKSIHREMLANGYSKGDIVRLASELLETVADAGAATRNGGG
jgi:hypothetical protein